MSQDQRNQHFDALIIGVGFAGAFLLHELRKLGYSVKALEAGSGIGGIWNRIRYPGFRVDTEIPYYEFSDEELWRDWSWKERFPGKEEMHKYFEYVDQKWDLSRDINFNTFVSSASFDQENNIWNVKTGSGEMFSARFMLPCTGFGSKPYTPDLPGIESFKGLRIHSARWPDDVDLRDKKVGIIGTGATGVQIIQEIAPIVSHLAVFQRTPNMALPMRQRLVPVEEQTKQKEEGLYPIFRRRCLQTFAGFPFDLQRETVDGVSPEERHMYYEDAFQKGSFWFWLGAYKDTYANSEANNRAYEFWREKTRARITDPVLQEKLAPTVPPHPFGTKRPSLEQYYFETYSRDNVTLADIRENPIAEIVPEGVKLNDGQVVDVDVLIFATGFDAVTGGITQIDIHGTGDVSIKEKWEKGVSSYLGTMT
jgi:cation diffusion facilitator CzcD-associated flavoprotein CzcO